MRTIRKERECSNERINIQLRKDMPTKAQIKDFCYRNNITLAGFVCEALTDFLKQGGYDA